MNIINIIVVLLAILGAMLYARQLNVLQKAQDALKQTREKLKKEWQGVSGKRGFYVGPVTMLVMRWPLSLLAAILAVGLPYLLIVALSTSISLSNSWQIFGILVLLLTAILGLPDGKLLVPVNTVAPMTFFGTLKRFYLHEGDYNWWLAKFFFRRSMVIHRNFTTRVKDNEAGKPQMEDGYYKITRVPFVLWNNPVSRVSTIDAISKSGSKLQAEFLITLESDDPYLVLRGDNPGLEIAERARSGFRTAISYFTSMDVALMKDVISLLIEGTTIVVAFTTKSINGLSPGSVVRDTGGEPQYRKVEIKFLETEQRDETTDEATKRTIHEYTTFLETHLTTTMKGAVSKKPVGKDRVWAIETREVATSLNEILNIYRLRLVSASVGTVILDKQLTEAAVTAEKQDFEGSVQVRSAKATAAALKQLQPSAEDRRDPTYADRLAVAAAGDPGATNTSFARVSSSGNPFVEAAAVVAGAFGKKTKSEEGTKA